MPTLLWGLPEPLRRRLGRQLAAGRRAASDGHLPPLPSRAWLVYLAVVTAWHIPMAYDAAQGNSLIHDLEHVSFFLSAGLFWWHVFAAGAASAMATGHGTADELSHPGIHPQPDPGIAPCPSRRAPLPYYARRGGASWAGPC
ncbi:MAG: cytochrome c oxidase assembly protein [Ardenticatenia bacterium]|nr:cytochrome c oxidase assembly protein [Ardenticatenia bacterium]